MARLLSVLALAASVGFCRAAGKPYPRLLALVVVLFHPNYCTGTNAVLISFVDAAPTLLLRVSQMTRMTSTR
jgi:hypothetical protein